MIGELVEHFHQHELIDLGEEGKSYSSRQRCNSLLNKSILPRWQNTRIDAVRAIDVENGLRSFEVGARNKSEDQKDLQSSVQSCNSVGVRQSKSNFRPGTGLRRPAERKATIGGAREHVTDRNP